MRIKRAIGTHTIVALSMAGSILAGAAVPWRWRRRLLLPSLWLLPLRLTCSTTAEPIYHEDNGLQRIPPGPWQANRCVPLNATDLLR